MPEFYTSSSCRAHHPGKVSPQPREPNKVGVFSPFCPTRHALECQCCQDKEETSCLLCSFPASHYHPPLPSTFITTVYNKTVMKQLITYVKLQDYLTQGMFLISFPLPHQRWYKKRTLFWTSTLKCWMWGMKWYIFAQSQHFVLCFKMVLSIFISPGVDIYSPT